MPEGLPDGEGSEDHEAPPLPWHFRLMVGAVSLYLGYRAFQGIEWVTHHL